LDFREIKFGVKLPIPGFGESGLTLEGTWSASEKEIATAWAVYVELSTRIGITRLGSGTGNLREALDSLHALFLYTRSALHAAGPEITRRPSGIDAPLAEVRQKAGLNWFGHGNLVAGGSLESYFTPRRNPTPIQAIAVRPGVIRIVKRTRTGY
jgi:hypothetical protein